MDASAGHGWFWSWEWFYQDPIGKQCRRVEGGGIFFSCSPIETVMGMTKTHYDAHGMRMTVEAQSQSLLDMIDTLLGAYVGVTGGADGFRVRLDYGQIPAETDPELHDFWKGTLPDGTRMICRNGSQRRQVEMPGQVRADIDLAARVARFVVNPNIKTGLLETCFLPLLCECLGQAGHYVIHAASLFVQAGGQRRALIVSGMSGAGKTTLALALAGAGLGMLADDVTLYQAAPATQPGQIWGYPNPMQGAYANNRDASLAARFAGGRRLVARRTACGFPAVEAGYHRPDRGAGTDPIPEPSQPGGPTASNRWTGSRR